MSQRRIRSACVAFALVAGLSACAPPSHDPAETVEHRDARELTGLLEKPSRITYNDIVKHVLKDNCIACHSLSGAKPDKDAITYSANLTSYETLFNVFTPVITKGDVKDSSLYVSIAIKRNMPPAKDGYDPLTERQRELLRLWIENCAPKEATDARDCERIAQ